MNKYRVKLFRWKVDDFLDLEGATIGDWLEEWVQEGYKLVSLQPVSNDGTLYTLATMELTDDA